MSPHLRPYRDDTDYWRVRQFLREVFLLNGRREFAWSLLRWDYWRWHVQENIFNFNLAEAVFVWEQAGDIAAVLNADSPGEAFLQAHPRFRTPALEAEMLEIAEQRLAGPNREGQRALRVWADSNDLARQALLRDRGYARGDWPEYQRRRPLAQPIPDAPAPAGYVIRPLGDAAELPARSWVSWKAFHPDEPDDKYEGWEWYRNVQRGPLYRRDLDLVAALPDGAIAAFCTVWFDDVTRTAVFEPVGTHPDHQQRGLGKAVMAEGLRRAGRLGATLATVGSYSAPAHALYSALGFTDYDLSEPWTRTW